MIFVFSFRIWWSKCNEWFFIFKIDKKKKGEKERAKVKELCWRSSFQAVISSLYFSRVVESWRAKDKINEKSYLSDFSFRTVFFGRVIFSLWPTLVFLPFKKCTSDKTVYETLPRDYIVTRWDYNIINPQRSNDISLGSKKHLLLYELLLLYKTNATVFNDFRLSTDSSLKISWDFDPIHT